MLGLLQKYNDLISYVFFGVLTTLVNIVVYYILFSVLAVGNVPSTVVAWIVAVVFAFITNKIWVFESKSWKKEYVLLEASKFFSCRIGTGLFELFFMYFFVDVFLYNGLIMKILVNVIVVVSNYIFSKLFIFKTIEK